MRFTDFVQTIFMNFNGPRKCSELLVWPSDSNNWRSVTLVTADTVTLIPLVVTASSLAVLHICGYIILITNDSVFFDLFMQLQSIGTHVVNPTAVYIYIYIRYDVIGARGGEHREIFRLEPPKNGIIVIIRTYTCSRVVMKRTPNKYFDENNVFILSERKTVYSENIIVFVHNQFNTVYKIRMPKMFRLNKLRDIRPAINYINKVSTLLKFIY